MQGLVFKSPVTGDLNGFAHRVCEACGPYAAKHGSEALTQHIQNVTTEAELLELGALVCGVCGPDPAAQQPATGFELTEQDRQLVLDLCVLNDLDANGNVNSKAEVSQMLVDIFYQLR